MDIGIIANPASGKDIRRLSAGASISNNLEKSAVIRRFIGGLLGVSNPTIHFYPDTHRITSSALRELGVQGNSLDMAAQGCSEDSTIAACSLHGCDLVVSLGGDGTNRAIAKGWRDIPLIALSSGTNNAFPEMIEATTAGVAAGMIMNGSVNVEEVADICKTVEIQPKEGDRWNELALIDAVGTTDRFVGSRALLNTAHYIFAVLTEADPSNPGTSGIGGCVKSISTEEDAGLLIRFNGRAREKVRALVSPGIVQDISISECQVLKPGEWQQFAGPFMLALDGERELAIGRSDVVRMKVERNGPRLVDVKRALQLATTRGSFHKSKTDLRLQHAK